MDERDAASLPDAGQARGAVRTDAGQDDADADGAVPLGHGRRPEEAVDGGGIARCAGQVVQDQVAVFHRQAAGGRNDVDLVRQDRRRMRDLDNARSALLGRSGGRCSTTTNAMPGDAGRCCSSVASAAKPPADAPMPTMEKERGAVSGRLDPVRRGCARS